MTSRAEPARQAHQAGGVRRAGAGVGAIRPSEGLRPARRARGALSPGGPRVVAIGGGHGLARTLEAARCYASELTAVVSVADDGGSSGRLRQLLGMPAPGDVRRCLGALAPPDSPLAAALEHRFHGGELEGHAFGNLLLAVLTETAGGFLQGVEEACALLGTLGSVLPATTTPVVLKATDAEGRVFEGQTRVMASAGIERVFLEPAGAEVPTAAIEAITHSDQVLLGPGSLFTSVLAAAVPEAVTKALATTDGVIVYVCNLREQIPETAGYDVGRHVAALHAHGIRPDMVLVSSPGSGLELGEVPAGVEVVTAPLARDDGLVHDSVRLGELLARLPVRR